MGSMLQINLAQDRHKYPALVNGVINLGFNKMWRILDQLKTSQHISKKSVSCSQLLITVRVKIMSFKKTTCYLFDVLSETVNKECFGCKNTRSIAIQKPIISILAYFMNIHVTHAINFKVLFVVHHPKQVASPCCRCFLNQLLRQSSDQWQYQCIS